MHEWSQHGLAFQKEANVTCDHKNLYVKTCSRPSPGRMLAQAQRASTRGSAPIYTLLEQLLVWHMQPLLRQVFQELAELHGFNALRPGHIFAYHSTYISGLCTTSDSYVY